MKETGIVPLLSMRGSHANETRAVFSELQLNIRLSPRRAFVAKSVTNQVENI